MRTLKGELLFYQEKADHGLLHVIDQLVYSMFVFVFQSLQPEFNDHMTINFNLSSQPKPKWIY